MKTLFAFLALCAASTAHAQGYYTPYQTVSPYVSAPSAPMYNPGPGYGERQNRMQEQYDFNRREDAQRNWNNTPAPSYPRPYGPDPNPPANAWGPRR